MVLVVVVAQEADTRTQKTKQRQANKNNLNKRGEIKKGAKLLFFAFDSQRRRLYSWFNFVLIFIAEMRRASWYKAGHRSNEVEIKSSLGASKRWVKRKKSNKITRWRQTKKRLGKGHFWSMSLVCMLLIRRDGPGESDSCCHYWPNVEEQSRGIDYFVVNIRLALTQIVLAHESAGQSAKQQQE